MAKEILQYNVMVEAALRAVVRQSLIDVARVGLPGNHHFYITFRTAYPGAQVPDYLKARYPAEMTIVLQHQFEDLEVEETFFGVTLTFNHIPERLVVPFSAITVFADPSVNFALPFQAPELPPEEPAPLKPVAKDAVDKPADTAEKSGEVVSLDKFRKK
ncbi:MAG TPA: ClpXP protease specificity-enhancing factor SspB [Alphaproteobacteria bacterium]|jgi:hypothetical protein|nr:ClpXP protease specificity-enhancing factor SspB [Alphaproteobacteria bacterium]